MPAAASLRKIVDGLDMQIDETASYLDRETGEVHTVSCEVLRDVEGGSEPEDLPEWQRNEYETAGLILNRIVQCMMSLNGGGVSNAG